MAASPFPLDFYCVRIPEDASEPCEEVRLTARKPGDLTEWVRPRFAGGALSHVDALVQQFGEAAVEGKMDALNSVSAKGSVELGHSGEVANCRFALDDETLVTVGKNDRAIVVWRLVGGVSKDGKGAGEEKKEGGCATDG